MGKNLCGKTRTADKPYETWQVGNWIYKVLKKYQADDEKPYARAFCKVFTPICPNGELGDVYISTYKSGTCTFRDETVVS